MRKSSPGRREFFGDRHRAEHWYRDNTVYFITSRCRDKYPAFDSEQAKLIFWDRFLHYAKLHTFFPLVMTVMNNHYHALGYMRRGEELREMMRKIHGSVAKLVNDILPERRVPFWRDSENKDYFDGCIRDALQARRSYRYTLMQAVRAGIVRDYRLYPHTRIFVPMEPAIRRATELNAFLPHVPYKRYERRDPGAPGAGT